MTLALPALAAETPEFRIYAPDTTGMPGQSSVMFARFAPDGDLWVSSRTGAIWVYGGIGIFNGDSWTTHSSRSTPLQIWNYEVDWDSKGNAWIACENHIVKYDGETWTTYGPDNSPLVGDRNWDLAIDADDHIWVTNDDIQYVQGGLFEFDGTTWIHHDEPFMNTFFGESVPFGVHVRRNGEVWATFEFMSGNAKHADGVWTHQPGPQILEFAETSDGTLYGVNGLGTYRYNDQTQSWMLIANYTSDVIAVDAQDRIYVGDDAGVYRFANSAWTFFATAPSGVNSIDFDASGDVWVAYDHSVRQYAEDGTGKHIYSSVTTGIGDYILSNIERDNEGNMWFMSGETGATRFDGQRYRNFGKYGHEETFPFLVNGQLLSEPVDDVFQDSDGNIWFAANGVARSSDLENWDLWYFGNANMPYDGMMAIGEDANGDIWAGSNGSGLYRFTGTDWEYRELGPYYDAQRVQEIVTTTDGVMWVATYAGVHRFDGTTWSYIGGYSAFLPGTPRDLAAGADGTLWVATTQGLSHFDGTSWFVYGPHNAPFMHSNISCIAVRDDGLVAACSEDVYNYPYSGDLCLFDGADWRQFPGGYENPNPFYQASAMEFDSGGHLWVAQVNFGAVRVMVGDATTTPEPDLTGDGIVNVFDLLALLGQWGTCADASACPADLTQDGVVNVFDLLHLLGAWG